MVFEQHTASLRLVYPKGLVMGFWICVVIALAAVVRRLMALVNPGHPGSSPTASLDATFASHAALTIVHILPAAVFVILAVIVLLRAPQNRWIDKLFFMTGAITGLTAYALSAYAIGGWIERAAVFVFDTWFLYCLTRAFWFGVRGNEARKREWMTRGVGVLLGIATTRPVMGVFFAMSARTHLAPSEFFGWAFWIGFSINALVTEALLHSSHQQLAKER